MNAWQSDDTRPIPGVFQNVVEQPVPNRGEVLIQVHAAGVTPSELQWYPTTHTNVGTNRRHAIPGHEFSGVVVAMGDGVDLKIGQEVFGMNDWYAEGATAEFCCTVPSAVAQKPARLTHVEAASIPIAALTAWQGLFDRARLQPGERVLIHGGSGAVGVIAVQLARWRGAQVITTASARNREFLLQLGASQVIDYRTEQFEDFSRGVDVVFDTVGGSMLSRSWNVLGPAGRLVTIAADGESTPDERTKQAFFIVEPNQHQLLEITGLLDSGHLRPIVDAVVPFDQAGAAYVGQNMPRRGHGRIVVAVIPED
ncbi:MAG: NADP-dependent oxidoreductase [Planctomycetaceae bacterium]|nr:NADP-dependent oxidoreductase [Planctomycetaceae bacterium]